MSKIWILVVITLLLFSHAFAEESYVGQGISSLVPTTMDLLNWETPGEPKHVIGDELYELINGGAEIYYEYGFKQAVSQVYRNKNQKRFNLEIYEMQNAEAAYGVYSIKTGSQGKKIPMEPKVFLRNIS